MTLNTKFNYKAFCSSCKGDPRFYEIAFVDNGNLICSDKIIACSIPIYLGPELNGVYDVNTGEKLNDDPETLDIIKDLIKEITVKESPIDLSFETFKKVYDLHKAANNAKLFCPGIHNTGIGRVVFDVEKVKRMFTAFSKFNPKGFYLYNDILVFNHDGMIGLLKGSNHGDEMYLSRIDNPDSYIAKWVVEFIKEEVEKTKENLEPTAE